jgi:phage terminase large subunit GpA-like protein
MVQQHIGQLLPPVAAAAHTAQKAIHAGALRGTQFTPQRATTHAAQFARTRVQARWLCSLAGKHALQEQAGAVLSVRRVPKEVAAIVQQAGLQLTAASLVAAARARVEGLESWLVEPYCSKLDPVVQAVLAGRVVSCCEVMCMLGRACGSLPSSSLTILAGITVPLGMVSSCSHA